MLEHFYYNTIFEIYVSKIIVNALDMKHTSNIHLLITECLCRWLPPWDSPHPWWININNRHLLGNLHCLHRALVQQHLLDIVLAVPDKQYIVCCLRGLRVSSPDGELEGRHVLIVDLIDVGPSLEEYLDDLLPPAAHSVVQRSGVPGLIENIN